MKKSLLAALGIAGACALCCSVPIGLTAASLVSMLGVAGWVTGSTAWWLAGAALALASIAAVAWRRARRSSCAPQVACSTNGCACR